MLAETDLFSLLSLLLNWLWMMLGEPKIWVCHSVWEWRIPVYPQVAIYMMIHHWMELGFPLNLCTNLFRMMIPVVFHISIAILHHKSADKSHISMVSCGFIYIPIIKKQAKILCGKSPGSVSEGPDSNSPWPLLVVPWTWRPRCHKSLVTSRWLCALKIYGSTFFSQKWIQIWFICL